MIEDNIFYSRLKLEIEKTGKSFNKVERDLGYSRNVLHDYKFGTIPSGVRLIEIANYFNISPAYLIGKTDLKEEKKPLDIFEELNNSQKIEMSEICKIWLEE